MALPVEFDLTKNSKVEEAVQWYSKNQSLYGTLASRVESIARQVLDANNINYHSVTSRVKDIERYRIKASNEKYREPRFEIMDMAGVRIITYLDSEAIKVAEIVKDSFEIFTEYSIDKTQELGTDRVGYRSIHFIATLGEKRCSLPENKSLLGLKAEIQIRSILQHAWAEFEHDRNYKFKGVLPDELKRRFAITAGTLELIDREFNSISNAIGAYTVQIQEKTQTGDLRTPVNSASLKTYLNNRFGTLIARGLIPNFADDKKIIDELSIMGINTLEELAKAIPSDLTKTLIAKELVGTYMGLLRIVMTIKDPELYFRRAWRQSWDATTTKNASILKYYGIDIYKYQKEFGLEIV